MAESRLDALEKVPAWQLGLAWLLVAGLIVLGWYFVYFSDAMADKDRAGSMTRLAIRLKGVANR